MLAGRTRAVAVLAALAAPAAAPAAPPLGLRECAPVAGVVRCDGVVRSWDGVPLDTTVVLPREGATRNALVVALHGFGNSKEEYLNAGDSAYTGNAYEWARAGFAVLAYTARGLWGSCGTPEARAAGGAACARGYVRLADVRYEVRDTQELVGRLVDEGVADPRRIAATGDSYGGGQSLMLAALGDRVMLPDGRLVAWRSPRGVALRLAAAAPVIPWSDLLGAIAPNGRTRTSDLTPLPATYRPVGVFKSSFANAIAAAAQFATGPGQPAGQPFVPGRPMGFLAPAGSDPEADVLGWVARANEGEPYDDAGAQAIVERLRRFRSPYQLAPARRPVALLIAAGFTDDLFPVSEALRYTNRLRVQRPDTPLRVVTGDFGHQRSSQKPAARRALLAEIRAWFDRFVRGDGPAPRRGAVASTQTCPRGAPPGGPFQAPSFAQLARGVLRSTWVGPQTVSSAVADPQTAAAIDPVAGGGDACATVGTARAAGTAVYERPARATLIGAPRITADLRVQGDPARSQIAARLWDVAPGGAAQTLVARGLYRPRGDGRQTWEMFPGAWRFAPGHRVKLELLGGDPPYARASNSAFEITVDRLRLALPVREAAGPGIVARPPGRLRLRVRCAGARRLAVRARVTGGRARRLDVRGGQRRRVTDRRPPWAAKVRAARRVSARAVLGDGRMLRAVRRAPHCG